MQQRNKMESASLSRIANRPTGEASRHFPDVLLIDTEGNAASLSSSTGSGSGVIVPGTGIHLNNMLGEYDLVAGGPAVPGKRLTSMMAPTVVVGAGGPRLVVGSAGSVRLRSEPPRHTSGSRPRSSEASWPVA